MVTPVGQSTRQATNALDAFKEWSNYLLVTTVASAGWVSTRTDELKIPWLQPVSLGLLTASIILAIFTLALVPLLAEQLEDESIYKTPISFDLLGLPCKMYLTQVCRPQHTTFIFGVLAYAVGAADVQWGSRAVAVLVLSVAVICVHGAMSKPGVVAGLKSLDTKPSVAAPGAADEQAHVRWRPPPAR
jgi:hypothetical protein